MDEESPKISVDHVTKFKIFANLKFQRVRFPANSKFQRVRFPGLTNECFSEMTEQINDASIE